MQATAEGHITDVDKLVRGAQKGDARSFASLYEHFFDQIFRYVSFKVGNSTEAEDITGEVFVRMLERITSYKPQGYPFSSWLFRVAHNLVVDYFRKKGKRKFTDLETVETTLGQAPVDIEGHVDQQVAMQQVYIHDAPRKVALVKARWNRTRDSLDENGKGWLDWFVDQALQPAELASVFDELAR